MPAGVALLDGGTLSFTLLGEIEDCAGLIAVDAAQLDAPPGTVEVFEGEAMDSFLRSGKCASVHEVSLAELLDMARLTQRLPARRALVAVQPDHIGWATELSPVVDLGLQLACNRIRGLLAEWSA
jgi:hydrogenase maturation protease